MFSTTTVCIVHTSQQVSRGVKAYFVGVLVVPMKQGQENKKTYGAKPFYHQRVKGYIIVLVAPMRQGQAQFNNKKLPRSQTVSTNTAGDCGQRAGIHALRLTSIRRIKIYGPVLQSPCML